MMFSFAWCFVAKQGDCQRMWGSLGYHHVPFVNVQNGDEFGSRTLLLCRLSSKSIDPSHAIMTYGLVWFKRDLRWQDHEALTEAAKSGFVRCIYVIEPQLWQQHDLALQHFEFVRESLQAVDEHLRTLGGCVEIHTGELPEVLTRIWHDAPFSTLYSHQETGNSFTYQRDLNVAAWC